MQIETLILEQPVSRRYNKEFNLLFSIFLAALAAITVAAIFFVKAKTSLDVRQYPFLFFYSLMITTFQLSRLAAALFYRRSLSKVIKDGETAYPYNGYSPAVTFVIPCKNEEKVIATSVTRCFEAAYPREKIEVIVIDDGSTDNTYEILKSLQDKFANLTVVHWKKNRGKRHGMAEGFRRATGEIIVQLDSDSWIDSNSFKKLINPFKNPEVGAVCAHSEPANAEKNILTKMQAAYYYMSFRILKSTESVFNAVFCCSGCASAYRKSAVTDILDSWLNEKFLGQPATYGDDRSLTSWVLRQGYKTIYAADALAFTVVPENFKTLIKQQLRWKKSWFINAFITGRFLIWQRPMIALFYFFPLVAISFLNPVMAFYALVYMPAFHGILPLAYLIGIALVNSLVVIFYRSLSPDDRYWRYLYGWAGLNVFVLTPLMFYAIARIQDRGWGTR